MREMVAIALEAIDEALAEASTSAKKKAGGKFEGFFSKWFTDVWRHIPLEKKAKARQVGISSNYCMNLRKGYTSISLQQAKKLCKILSLDYAQASELIKKDNVSRGLRERGRFN